MHVIIWWSISTLIFKISWNIHFFFNIETEGRELADINIEKGEESEYVKKNVTMSKQFCKWVQPCNEDKNPEINLSLGFTMFVCVSLPFFLGCVYYISILDSLNSTPYFRPQHAFFNYILLLRSTIPETIDYNQYLQYNNAFGTN